MSNVLRPMSTVDLADTMARQLAWLQANRPEEAERRHKEFVASLSREQRADLDRFNRSRGAQ